MDGIRSDAARSEPERTEPGPPIFAVSGCHGTVLEFLRHRLRLRSSASIVQKRPGPGAIHPGGISTEVGSMDRSGAAVLRQVRSAYDASGAEFRLPDSGTFLCSHGGSL